MTVGQFNNLNDEEKKIALFEATKISEKFEDLYKCELFQIGDFFIESRTDKHTKINRTLKTFPAAERPVDYLEITE